MYMQVTINVPEEVAAAAQAQGLSVQAYIEEMVVRNAEEPLSEARLREISAAVDHLKELSERSRLDGLKIKDLIHESHKY